MLARVHTRTHTHTHAQARTRTHTHTHHVSFSHVCTYACMHSTPVGPYTQTHANKNDCHNHVLLRLRDTSIRCCYLSSFYPRNTRHTALVTTLPREYVVTAVVCCVMMNVPLSLCHAAYWVEVKVIFFRFKK